MKRWDYAVDDCREIHFAYRRRDERPRGSLLVGTMSTVHTTTVSYGDVDAAQLNEWGARGWELVTIEDGGRVCTFKRES